RGEGDGLGPDLLTDDIRRQPGAGALMDYGAAAKVRQRERVLSIAAVGRADQTEKRCVAGDREQRSVAERPSLRGEVPGERADFSNVRFRHRGILLAARDVS